MTRSRAVLVVATVGVALPYLARVPGAILKGNGWLAQYLDVGLSGAAFLEAFNLVAVAAAMGVTALFFHRSLWLIPVMAGYGFLLFAHGTLDLASDAQAGIALVFFPIYSLPFFVVGSAVAAVARRVVATEDQDGTSG